MSNNALKQWEQELVESSKLGFGKVSTPSMERWHGRHRLFAAMRDHARQPLKELRDQALPLFQTLKQNGNERFRYADYIQVAPTTISVNDEGALTVSEQHIVIHDWNDLEEAASYPGSEQLWQVVSEHTGVDDKIQASQELELFMPDLRERIKQTEETQVKVRKLRQILLEWLGTYNLTCLWVADATLTNLLRWDDSKDDRDALWWFYSGSYGRMANGNKAGQFLSGSGGLHERYTLSDIAPRISPPVYDPAAQTRKGSSPKLCVKRFSGAGWFR